MRISSTCERVLALMVLGLMLCVASHAGTAPRSKGTKILEPFDYHGVTLDDGRLKAQFDEVRDYYLRIQNDGLLKGFRERAGRPAPGAGLGGWYDMDMFHIFGQILSGLARMYAATGDPACRDKANVLLQGWGECIASDGFFYYSRQPIGTHYIYDKMVGGLVDMYIYCDNREALDYLSRITDWAIPNLSRGKSPGETEWYTLSENLYRAYLVTGDRKYRDFAEVWEYTEYWDMHARRRHQSPRTETRSIEYADYWDLSTRRVSLFGSLHGTRSYHAYSHVNTLGGAGAAYLVKGEPHYLGTLRNAYDYLQKYQCFATGGYGPEESFLPHAKLIRAMADSHHHFETQCGSWAAFKMAKYLVVLTGDAKYGDWIERLAINGIGASVPMSSDGGVMYFSDYNLSCATKRNSPGWTCCAGTRPMAIADYHDLIYFKDAHNIYVNLFASSTVRWNYRGSVIIIRQHTRFPESSGVEFTVSVKRPAEFGIKIREPEWLDGPVSAWLNGKAATMKTDARGWATLRRVWREGDRLTITLPMSFWLSPFDPSGHPVAIMRGPVVMAIQSLEIHPSGKIDLTQIDRELARTPGKPLTYHLASDPRILVQPLYAFGEGEPYFVYLDPAMAKRILHRAFTFSPGWLDAGRYRHTGLIGATAECAFEGTGFRWFGCRYDDGGRAEVAIDDSPVAVVDQYGPVRDMPFEWEYRGLSPGKHTIRITVLPEKAEKSRGYDINIGSFEPISLGSASN